MELARREKLELKLAHQKSITKKALKWYKDELLYGGARARVRNPSKSSGVGWGGMTHPVLDPSAVVRGGAAARARARARVRNPSSPCEVVQGAAAVVEPQ